MNGLLPCSMESMLMPEPHMTHSLNNDKTSPTDSHHSNLVCRHFSKWLPTAPVNKHGHFQTLSITTKVG